MYKVLASAGVWHAGIQLCCRDDPEVIVMARVCVFLGLGAGCVPGVGEGTAGAGSGKSFPFYEGFWFKGNRVSLCRVSIPRNGAAALLCFIWFFLNIS